MKKLSVSLAAVASTIAFAPAAQAAQTIIITGPSGVFANDDVTCATGVAMPCTFTNTFTFTTPTGFNLASADISSTATPNPLTDINFTSVTLNGVAFNTLATGVSEFRNLLGQSLIAGGTNTLVVTGTTGGNAAFSGNLSFAANAVPEPATWAMMAFSFGGLGVAMRRRPKATKRIRFA